VKEVILNHLVKVIHKHAHELLSRDDFKLLIDKVKETSPALVDELIPGILPMATVHRVVTLLLEEQVPITNMVRILESLAINGLGVKTPPELVEMIRPDLGRSIAERFRDEFGVVHAIAILPEVEEELRNMFGIGLRGNPAKPNLGLVQALIDRLKVEAENEKNRGREACLLTTAPLRRALRTLLMKQIPDLSVITREEMPNDIRLAYAAGISIDSLQVR
jgi:flagellar biosynthesis protein FlhA